MDYKFDDLVERGRPLNRQRPFLQIGMDSTQTIDNLQCNSDDAIQIFLHGDYRYDFLKNTDKELQTLDGECLYDIVKKEVHGFPVKRGTGLILDDADMLLWLPGNVMNLKSNRSYFQGKSRIPTPVRITRYAGDTPVETIASELLALTKMDWNNFAWYKQMPVTVTTPNSIARIGRLLHRLVADSYDYRLFM